MQISSEALTLLQLGLSTINVSIIIWMCCSTRQAEPTEKPTAPQGAVVSHLLPVHLLPLLTSQVALVPQWENSAPWTAQPPAASHGNTIRKGKKAKKHIYTSDKNQSQHRAGTGTMWSNVGEMKQHNKPNHSWIAETTQNIIVCCVGFFFFFAESAPYSDLVCCRKKWLVTGESRVYN